MTPARSTQLLATTLRAQVHTVDSGHAIMAEVPEELLRIIAQATR